ncbi:MAG TPA: hypothetical protein DCM59_06845 [Clostridium sp.]|nr:hypothetical protein [Clostridium sp.]
MIWDTSQQVNFRKGYSLPMLATKFLLLENWNGRETKCFRYKVIISVVPKWCPTFQNNAVRRRDKK